MLTKKIENKTRLGQRSYIELAKFFENTNYEFLLECGAANIKHTQEQMLLVQTEALKKIGIHKNYF